MAFAWDLGCGDPAVYDEFLTLERSMGFARNGDWLTVYSNYEPVFKKPPLQYYLTAAATLCGISDLSALRFWPYIYTDRYALSDRGAG